MRGDRIFVVGLVPRVLFPMSVFGKNSSMSRTFQAKKSNGSKPLHMLKHWVMYGHMYLLLLADCQTYSCRSRKPHVFIYLTPSWALDFPLKTSAHQAIAGYMKPAVSGGIKGSVVARRHSLMFLEIIPSNESLSKPLRQEFVEASGWWSWAAYVCHGSGIWQFHRGFYVACSHFAILP